VPSRPPRGKPAPALVSASLLARVLASTHDRALLVATAADACRDALGGTEWRFFALDLETGALRDPFAVAYAAGAVLPEPGGVLEALLAHEEPVYAREGAKGDPSLDARLWRNAPRLVLGWPVASGGALRGLLLVASGKDKTPAADAVASARLAVDQLALALEREAWRESSRARAQAMVGLEQRAATGEAMFSELISVVAHEIRTPLTSIKAYTETLIDAPATEFEQRRKFLGVIDEECDRLSRLVGDALDLSRLEAGHRSLKLRTLAPAEFLADLVSTVEPEASRRGVTLVVEMAPSASPDAAVVEGDSDLMKQLLLNLIGNAIKFSPEGGRISVRSRLDEAEWHLEVQDEGTGIPDEQLDRIFERFYRIELRGGRRVPGTGLGLAIARHIAQLHDGQVWATNADPTGSMFSVRLPRLQRAPVAARGVAGALLARSDVRALLDDAVEMVGGLMHAGIVSILWVDPEEGDLVVRTARGLDEAALTRRIPYRAGVAGAALRAGQAILVDNIETDRRFGKKNHPQYFTKSLLAAPIVVAGESIGVLNVNNKDSHEEFVESDRALLATLVTRLAGALTRAYAYPGAPSVVVEARQTVRAVTSARRDTQFEDGEAARLAALTARQLGLEPAEGARIARLAGTGENEAKGNGAGGDSRAELELLRPILLARAERFDGSGLPHRKKGDDIPVGARILAALDRYESLVKGRAWRPGATPEEAVAALMAARGKALDPRVVDALCVALGATRGTHTSDTPGTPDAPDAPEREAA
jgi:signal transduction histidine kinase/putative methionine-R-sulfoxide reductase with GAF domain